MLLRVEFLVRVTRSAPTGGLTQQPIHLEKRNRFKGRFCISGDLYSMASDVQDIHITSRPSIFMLHDSSRRGREIHFLRMDGIFCGRRSECILGQWRGIIIALMRAAEKRNSRTPLRCRKSNVVRTEHLDWVILRLHGVIKFTSIKSNI